MDATPPAAEIPRKVRPIVPSSEAQERIVAVTIGLLRELPFDQVTARRITDSAKLSLSTISRNFRSMEGLFSYVSSVLLANALGRMRQLQDPRIFFDPDFILRSRLIAWLIAEGADPRTFSSSEVAKALDQFQAEVGRIGSRISSTWLNLSALILEGYAVFGGVHNLSQAEFLDGVALMARMRELLPQIEEEFGWNEDRLDSSESTKSQARTASAPSSLDASDS